MQIKQNMKRTCWFSLCNNANKTEYETYMLIQSM